MRKVFFFFRSDDETLILFLHFSGKDNVKSTIEEPVVDFEACLNSIKKKTIPLVNPKPITLNQLQITAFSYYFERAIETGMIGKRFT